MHTQFKKHSYITVLLFFYTLPVHAQYNLVPNYSFEQYTVCPTSMTLYQARADKPDLWYKPDRRDAVYYNACANNNNIGVPINFFGGGIAFNMQELGLLIWLCSITMVRIQEIMYK